jgi:hypothetical protein
MVIGKLDVVPALRLQQSLRNLRVSRHIGEVAKARVRRIIPPVATEQSDSKMH